MTYPKLPQLDGFQIHAAGSQMWFSSVEHEKVTADAN